MGLGAWLDVFVPPRCAACDDELESAADVLCATCRAGAVAIFRGSCRACGAEPEADAVRATPDACRRCRTGRFVFRRATAALRYAGPVRAVVHGVKFGRRREAIPFLAARLAAAVLERGLAARCDAVVSVPLHPLRRLRRGFDQAELLARALAHEIDHPFVPRALRRRRHTSPQAQALPGQRRAAMERAFAAGRGVRRVRGRRVLLVDDVMSTGATVDAAARVLLASGVAAVDVAVAAT